MTKSILTISRDQFQGELYKIGTKNLVGLLEGLVKFKWEYGKYWPDEQINDMERKHSMIEKELQRRGYLDKSSRGQYNDWMKSINRKKRIW